VGLGQSSRQARNSIGPQREPDRRANRGERQRRIHIEFQINFTNTSNDARVTTSEGSLDQHAVHGQTFEVSETSKV
jgi:hypothetical protein